MTLREEGDYLGGYPDAQPARLATAWTQGPTPLGRTAPGRDAPGVSARPQAPSGEASHASDESPAKDVGKRRGRDASKTHEPLRTWPRSEPYAEPEPATPEDLAATQVFSPTLCRVVDLERPLAEIPPGLASPLGQRYACGRFTVRLAGRPVATVNFEIPPEGLDPASLSAILHPPTASVTPEGPSLATISDAPLVSVVIATKDREAELRRCLDRLLASSYDTFEVLVVDNGPTNDRTARMVRTLPDPRVRYINLPVAGVSRARNRGLAEAEGSIIAFTDDDVEVDGSWLERLVRTFTTSPDSDAVTGLVVPAALDTSAQLIFEEMGGFDRGLQPRTFTLRSDPTGSAMYPFAVGNLGSGNNMAFRRESLERLGGFDESLGPGTRARAGEDMYLLLDVLLSGGTLRYEPAAIVRHHHRSDPAELIHQLTGYGAGLTAVYMRCLMRDPRTALAFLARVPAGLRHLRSNVLSPFSGLRKHSATPTLRRQMIAAERRGMLRGPWWYLRGRFVGWRTRSPRRSARAAERASASARPTPS